ncbi:MAG TPA: glycosyltransferase [Verrucomicrobiae bacterium]|nr:glycosyltransferase [Verrucomicrobiae bacterium]
MAFSGTHPSIEDVRPRPVQNSFGEGARPRPWRVIHACEFARDVLPVVEGQVTSGMKPYIVTPQGEGSAELYLSGRRQDQPRSLSLLRSWQDVRNWRKSILDCDPENSADIVHTHCFAAGMAAVRNIGGVVYDLRACIEELAMSAGQCEHGSWMGRSFRVAEQFVLARAAAVIVHSSGMKDAARQRGALAESIFLIPDPLPIGEDSPLRAQPLEQNFLQHRFGIPAGSVSFLVPQFATPAHTELSAEQKAVLESFALARAENPRFSLLLEIPTTVAMREALEEFAAHLKIREDIVFIDLADSASAWQSADVILATGELPADAVVARSANEICLNAMLYGKTLLAADVPRNRDVSPEGRGCLWFEDKNPRDLAFRISFLQRNPSFRAALAAAGRFHVLETRSTAAIGRQYREAYNYAFGRKRFTGPSTGVATLQPAANWG